MVNPERHLSYLGIMQMMSTQGSDQEEVECWEEASAKTYPGANSAERKKEAISLDDSTKPRWSI